MSHLALLTKGEPDRGESNVNISRTGKPGHISSSFTVSSKLQDLSPASPWSLLPCPLPLPFPLPLPHSLLRSLPRSLRTQIWFTSVTSQAVHLPRMFFIVVHSHPPDLSQKFNVCYYLLSSRQTELPSAQFEHPLNIYFIIYLFF